VSGAGGRLKFREGVNPNAVLAATTVSLTPNYNKHDVYGTTQIDTINVGGNTTGANSMYSDVIYLTVKEAFSFGTGGNIVAQTAAGAARTVGDVVKLFLDPITPAWIEIGSL
jgi:hypothetical protein